MNALVRFYNRTDRWLRDLSRAQSAVVLGLSGGAGSFVVGSLLDADFVLVQALTFALVFFTLEYVFGSFQSKESA